MTVLRGALVAFLKDGIEGDDLGVFPVRMPLQPPARSITVADVSDYSGYVHTGRDGLTRRRLQLDIWTGDHDSTDALAEEVEALLAGYRGPMGDLIFVGSCVKDNEFDADDTPTRFWRRIQDYQFEYNERAGS